MKRTRLLLVRHGEPSRVVRGRCYGRLDPPLSTAGRRQMRATKRWISDLDDVHVYCSPLRRAVESAGLLAGRRPVTVDDRLREIDFGAFEGLPYTEIEQRYPDLFRAWMAHPTGVTFPGGEPFEAMAGRVRDALTELRRRRTGQTTIVVAHGGVNRIVLADALGLPLASMFRLAQDHGCVNVVEYVGDAPVVRAVNLTEAPC